MKKQQKCFFFTDWLICNFRECHPIIIVQRIRVTSCFCQLPRPTDLWAFDQQDSTEMIDTKTSVSCCQDYQGYGHVTFGCPRKCAPNSYFSAMCRISSDRGLFQKLIHLPLHLGQAHTSTSLSAWPTPKWSKHRNVMKRLKLSIQLLCQITIHSRTYDQCLSIPSSRRGNSMLRMLWAPHQQLFVALEGLLLWQCHVETLIKGPVYFRKSKAKKKQDKKMFKTSNKISGHEIPRL